MSTARFSIPKIRLAALLRKPGGRTVADAIQKAEANLESIKQDCRNELLSLVDQADEKFAVLGEGFDEAGLTDLYAVAARGIGNGAFAGAPGVDQALSSLCDLLDHLRTGERLDREAIGVHLRAWRLLLIENLPPAGADEILSGLQKVSARAAPPPAAA